MPSSIAPQRELAQRIRVAPEEVAIAVWPLRQQPFGSLLALALAGGASWLLAWSFRQPWLGAAAAGVLALTLWRMWLPVTYEIGVSGVTQVVLGRRRRISWPAIRSYQVRGDGVLLVPDAQVAPLSPLRGLYVPWLGQREKVVANVEYYLQAGRNSSAG